MTKKEQAKILYEVDCLPAKEIAKRVGYGEQYVFRLARENEWVRGPNYNHALTRQQTLQEAVDQSKIIPDKPSGEGIPFHEKSFLINDRSYPSKPSSMFDPYNKFSDIRGAVI